MIKRMTRNSTRNIKSLGKDIVLHVDQANESVKKETAQKFSDMDVKFSGMDAKFSEMSSGMDAKFSEMDVKMTEIMSLLQKKNEEACQ